MAIQAGRRNFILEQNNRIWKKEWKKRARIKLLNLFFSKFPLGSVSLLFFFYTLRAKHLEAFDAKGYYIKYQV